LGAGHRTRNEWGSVAMIFSVSPRSSSFSSRPNTALVTRNASRASDQVMADTQVAALDHTIQQTNIWLKTRALRPPGALAFAR